MKAREQADQVADRARGELLSTLEELDRRRRRATDWKLQIRQHRVGLLLAAGGIVLAVGVAIARRGGARAGRRWRGARRRLASRQFALVPRRAERPEARTARAPAWQELLRKALVAFGVALASQAGRRAAAAMLSREPGHQGGERFLH